MSILDAVIYKSASDCTSDFALLYLVTIDSMYNVYESVNTCYCLNFAFIM